MAKRKPRKPQPEPPDQYPPAAILYRRLKTLEDKTEALGNLVACVFVTFRALGAVPLPFTVKVASDREFAASMKRASDKRQP